MQDRVSRVKEKWPLSPALISRNCDVSIEDPWDGGFGYRNIKAEAQRAVDDFPDEHREPAENSPDEA